MEDQIGIGMFAPLFSRLDSQIARYALTSGSSVDNHLLKSGLIDRQVLRVFD